MLSARQPYDGPSRALVIGIDIGTTYSGVSYSILEPGQVPEIKHVTRFPASQDRTGGDSKIPSLIWYDSMGTPKAFGAEAVEEAILIQAHDEKWTKVQWFKLFMAKSPTVHKRLPPLPADKTIRSVLSDFLEYLYTCTQRFIRQTHFNGAEIWDDATKGGKMHFVLSHPNAWDGLQQSEIRKAAISAGLVPDTSNGHARIQFVTEGEASLHFCLQQGINQNVVRAGKGILVIDAGGGTIDLSSYTPVSSEGKGGFGEIATPRCQFNGSIFVSEIAKKVLSKKLSRSRFANDIVEIIHCFDSTTKLRFRNIDQPAFIHFGRLNDNDPSVNIQRGQLKLTGQEVASFFEPSIQSVIKAVSAIGFDASESIESAFLVGGFAASDYLFTRLQQHFKPLGIQIFRPDTHINKAVSDGAVGYFVDRRVSIRISRYHYGIECSAHYIASHINHEKRITKKHTWPDGNTFIPDSFSTILPKNNKVTETKEFRQPYYSVYSYHPLDWLDVSRDILQYVGTNQNPEWLDEEPDNFMTLCSIVMDGRSASHLVTEHINSDTGSTYYKIRYDIVLRFGLTELEAQFIWTEDGVEKRSPAKIVYTDDAPAVVYGGFDTCASDDSDVE